jgi:hypothetical protein
MTEYVKIGKKVIETKEGDALFAWLWCFKADEIEKLGADTDFENDFGGITHRFEDGNLIKL